MTPTERAAYLEGYSAAREAAARIARPYHTCKAFPDSPDAFRGDGCPRYCTACEERRRIRNAILALESDYAK